MSASVICRHINIVIEPQADVFADSNVRLLKLRIVCLGCGKPMRFLGVREGVSIDAPAVYDRLVTMPFVAEGEEPDTRTDVLFS